MCVYVCLQDCLILHIACASLQADLKTLIQKSPPKNQASALVGSAQDREREGGMRRTPMLGAGRSPGSGNLCSTR